MSEQIDVETAFERALLDARRDELKDLEAALFERRDAAVRSRRYATAGAMEDTIAVVRERLAMLEPIRGCGWW